MKNNEINLTAVGDIMLGDFPLTLGFGVKSRLNANEKNDIFFDVQEELENSDICFANLETVLSNVGLVREDIKSEQMRGDGKFIKILKNAGFNILSIANNHIMQHGSEAFNQTVDTVCESGIDVVGLADNNRSVPKFISSNGLKICFLSYSLRPEKYNRDPLYSQFNKSDVVEDINRNKKKSDLLVLSLHWGDEFVKYPSSEQIELAHDLIDSGVDLILGHHSHMIQGIEKYKLGVIVYSLGNFVFDFWQNKFRETIIFKCKMVKGGIDSYEIIPVKISKLYKPIIVTGSDVYKYQKKFDKISKKISSFCGRSWYPYYYRIYVYKELILPLRSGRWQIKGKSFEKKKYDQVIVSRQKIQQIPHSP